MFGILDCALGASPLPEEGTYEVAERKAKGTQAQSRNDLHESAPDGAVYVPDDEGQAVWFETAEGRTVEVIINRVGGNYWLRLIEPPTVWTMRGLGVPMPTLHDMKKLATAIHSAAERLLERSGS